MNRAVACLVLAAIAPAGVAAQSTGLSEDRLLACTDVQDLSARLVCFDREMAPLVSARRAAQVAAPPAPQQPAPARAPTPASTPTPVPMPAPVAAAPVPGFGQEQMRASDRPAAPAEVTELHARISSTRRGGQGTYLVTLDNGQVWRHEEGSQAEYLKVGEAVTISRASMGSYRLTLDSGKSKNWVRVTRMR